LNKDLQNIELGEVVKLRNGKSIPKSEGKYSAFGGNGIVGYVNSYNSDEDTIVIGRVGANCGNVNFSGEKCWVTDNAIAVKVNSSNDPKYIYYALINEDLQRYKGGSAQPLLTQSIISKLQLSLPTKDKQKEISNQIDSFKEKIELNYKLICNLEEYSQLLFHKWFVDFNFPDVNGSPYKDSGGNMIEVEGEMIPEGWDYSTIGENSFNYDRKRIPLSNSERQKRKGKYPYYGATEIMDYVDDYIFDGLYCLIAEDGSVIDENNNPIMQLAWGKFWVNNHAHVLQGKGDISTEFLFLTLKRTNVSNVVTGAIQKKINQTNLNRIRMILPSKEVLKEFNKIVHLLFHKIIALSKENQLLTETRDLLIKKLIK